MSEQNEGDKPGLNAKPPPAARLVAAGRDLTSFHGFFHLPVVRASSMLYSDAADLFARRTRKIGMRLRLLPVLALIGAAALFTNLTAAGAADDAAQRAAGLDARFIELKAATSDAQAEPIVAAIWELWMQSGREEIDALAGRARTLMRAGANDLALRTLDDVVRRAPDYAEGWNMRATLLYVMGEYDRSLADCAEVLKREPRHFGALAGMGMIGIAQGNYKAALDAYRRALAVNPHLRERELISALEKKVEGQRL